MRYDYLIPNWYKYLFGYRGTLTGFCVYFIANKIDKNIAKILLDYFKVFRTTESSETFYFKNKKERIKAINKLINILK